MKKERLEMLGDGVVAIVMTLMILEIKLPELTGNNFILLAQNIGVYALSFVVLAIMWLNYNHIFLKIETVSPKIIWLNFLLLFMMSLIPLPTKALGENFYLRNSHIFYGAIMTANAISFSLLQMTVNKASNHLKHEVRSMINRKNWLSVSIYASSIPLSFISIWLSTAIFVLIAAVYFIPSKKLLEDK